MDIPMTVEHDYSGETVKPEKAWPFPLDNGRYGVRMQVGGIVFRNKSDFYTLAQAQRFCDLTIEQGGTVC